MIKNVVLFCVFSVLLLATTGCNVINDSGDSAGLYDSASHNAAGESGDIPVGSVSLSTEDDSYELYEEWIYELTDGLAADGARKQPREIADIAVPFTIPYGTDTQIIIDGAPLSSRLMIFRHADNRWEEVYSSNDAFTIPRESGDYILCLELSWGYDDHYVGYQYYTRFIRETFVGNVTVFSGGRQHEPYSRSICGFLDDMFFDSEMLSPHDAAEYLTPIAYGDDLKVVVEGSTVDNSNYCLYRLIDTDWVETARFSGSDSDILEKPDEPGEYILCVQLTWGDSPKYREYVSCQYFFLLVV